MVDPSRSLDFWSMVVNPVAGIDDFLPKHHVVIAGTGRAGTSFLVRFLNQCGLDTGSPTESFDERAQAGLEHNLLDGGAPYVVKDPWLFTYCERVDLQAVTIDALLVPVRELMAAASSRILQERVAMFERPWPDWPHSDVNGKVTAGAIYSLDPVDQARILAVGFHQLIHWATVKRIPLFLLEFPRIVNDSEYLIETLWPWLSSHCDRENAQAAFDTIADPLLVRIETPDQSDAPQRAAVDIAKLDREAMRIVLDEHRALVTAANDQLAESRESFVEIQTRLAESQGRLAETEGRLAETQRRLAETEGRLADTEGRLADTEGALAHSDTAIREYQMQLDAVLGEINAVHATLSWRITRPLRRVRASLRRNDTRR